jgi:hypothetical protein
VTGGEFAVDRPEYLGMRRAAEVIGGRLWLEDQAGAEAASLTLLLPAQASKPREHKA